MSKELLIIFVYDRELCRREEDDPQKSIIYFYPTWVSIDQRHALCSQLMGVTQFSSTLFSFPKIISLQSGKFTVTKFGRYSLCVGTDRNIPDVVLESRSKILYDLFTLFHKSIENIEGSLADEDLSERLSELLQVYLPILQYATNTFGNIPLLKIPKSSSALFLEAMNLLQSFQEIQGVFGGILLFQNKVIASQLNNRLTKQFVITDPYRIKLPCESVKGSFHLPVGVQLFTVYVPCSEIRRLQGGVTQLYSALDQIKFWRKQLETQTNKIGNIKGFESVSGMKREMSGIFTVVEEDTEFPDLVKDALKVRHLSRIETLQPANFLVTQPKREPKTSFTLDDIPSSKKIPIRYYSLGCGPKEIKKKKKNPLSRYYNTIADPQNLYFKENGLPTSSALSQSCLINEINSLKLDKKSPRHLPKKTPSSPAFQQKNERSKLLENKQKLQNAKRSFTLPLNSTSGTRNNGGIPLTPLMAKLSQLAEEGTILETPLKTPSGHTYQQTKRTDPENTINKSTDTISEGFRDEPSTENNDEELYSCVLYVFGIDNTSIILLIDPKTALQAETVHSLWERSILSLRDMDSRLKNVLCSEDGRNLSTDYSYAVVDPDWGPVERAGPYHPHQLELLTVLHHSLSLEPHITDLLLRSDDLSTYVYQCGGKQVFYQESCSEITGGIPLPSDIIGILPLKAKRVLERDQNLILL